MGSEPKENMATYFQICTSIDIDLSRFRTFSTLRVIHSLLFLNDANIIVYSDFKIQMGMFGCEKLFIQNGIGDLEYFRSDPAMERMLSK